MSFNEIISFGMRLETNILAFINIYRISFGSKTIGPYLVNYLEAKNNILVFFVW